MKVAAYVYAEYSYFLKEVIKFAKEKKLPIEWSVILYSNADNLFEDFNNLVGRKNVLYLQEKLNKYMEENKIDLDILKDFPVSIFECISASKVVSGEISLQSKSVRYQLKLVLNTYRAYKEFLLDIKPDFVLFFLIENYDAVILYYLCKEIEVETIICEYARNLGVSFFADSIDGRLPSYAYKENPPLEILEKAKKFIYSFRNNPIKSFEIKYKPKPDEVIKISVLERNIFKKGFRFLKKKMINLLFFISGKTIQKEPHRINQFTFFHRLRILFLPLTIKIRRFKGKIYKSFYDLHRIEQLPQKFIYYPLHYSPETSINIPAPYFIDQIRAIDLILNSMPANFYLVVKEHPAMEGIRPISFYKEIKKRANILLADFSLPSIEFVKRASLTISITGTSCLEAFLLGKPSLHLGRVFFSDWIYKFDSFYSFKTMIKEAIEAKISDEKIIDMVSRVLSIGSDFIILCPDNLYYSSDFVMNKINIENFLENLLKHIKKYEV